jgi:PhoD-like phosphatase
VVQRAVAWAGLAAAGVGVLLMAVLQRFPGAPEPLLIPTSSGQQLRVGCAVVCVGGFAVALRARRTGGAIALVSGCVWGGLLAFSAAAGVAAALGLAVVVPACILVISGSRAARTVAVACASVVLITAGMLTWSGYSFLYGATHPQSRVPGPPAGAVSWVWSGGVTSSEAVVSAKLTRAVTTVSLDLEPGARVRVVRDGVYVRFVVSGLPPDTRVRYAVRVGRTDDGSGVGAFRTLPSGPGSFTIAFSSCARTGSNGAVFDAIRAEDPLMYLNLGDLFYANVETADPARFARAYDHVLTRPAQANLARATSTSYVWDDHDFGGNDADGTAASAPAAHAVFRRLVPHHSLAIPGQRAPLARAFTAGRVRFIITDTRSSRSPKELPDGAAKTMLGQQQRAWFERELLEARDRFPVIVWINPDPWIGEPRVGSDSWPGYGTERRALADFIVANRITGLVMLSGDSHAVALDDGTNTDYSTAGRGGFPLLHAGALDRAAQQKGGPYSHGEFLGGGQFGTLRVDDTGGTEVTVTLSGRNWRRETLTSLQLRFPAR